MALSFFYLAWVAVDSFFMLSVSLSVIALRYVFLSTKDRDTYDKHHLNLYKPELQSLFNNMVMRYTEVKSLKLRWGKMFRFIITSTLFLVSFTNSALCAEKLSFTIISKENISYGGCKRLAVKIAVPDNASQEDVNFTLDSLLEDYKSWLDEAVVWAYRFSEYDHASNMAYTKGMREFSRCK